MLSLPLFEDRHRELAARLAGIVTREIEPHAARFESGDPNKAGREIVRILADAGLLNLVVPHDRADGPAGEPGLDVRSLCLAREALASASGLADSVFAGMAMGAYPIALAGDERLRKVYLPRIAAGEAIPAFALTEAGAGSDISGLDTSARREGEQYILNGRKRLISNAGIATFYIVFARHPFDDHDDGTGEGTGHDRPPTSVFVVDADTPGVSVRPIEMMAPHPIGEVTLEGCRTPGSRRIGAEGAGRRIALETLDVFRSSVGAAACGMAGRALGEARAHAVSRRLFGATLADLQATRFALAEMDADLDASRLLVCRAAWLKDQGTPRVTREAAIAKLFATETAQRIVDRAVQIHGGAGVTRGAAVERLYREVRALRISVGASEIQKVVIADQIFKQTDGEG